MSDHILKTIADIEARIDARVKETERATIKDRVTINDLCAIAGIEPKYNIDEAVITSGGSVAANLSNIKADEFFGKPQATCVRDALNMLRAAGRAPATVEAIYDVLVSGGFEFPTKAREAAIQGLAISIGKNSTLFVKLPSGLIGVKHWYGATNKARPRPSKSDDTVTEQPQSDDGMAETGDQPTQEAAQTNDGETL